jgi:putative hydrolase of the HAD superfamily
MRVPLLLVDLDDTLIDRSAAFARWARSVTSTDDDAEWLIAADQGGYADRDTLAAMITERLGPAITGDELRDGTMNSIVADDAVAAALDDARQAGWTPFVITNGVVPYQERKLRLTGLDQHVAGWVISEGVGLRKPDPEIFRLAARRAGQSLDGAWMVGDSGPHDILGAVNAGIDSVWLHRGRAWNAPGYGPTRTAPAFPEAVHPLLTTPGLPKGSDVPSPPIGGQ